MVRLRVPWRRVRRSGPDEPFGDVDDLLVLVAPGTGERDLARLALTRDAEVLRVAEPPGRRRERDAVVLVAGDLAALRRAVTGVPNVGRARRVAVLFTRPVLRLPIPAMHPGWPQVEELSATRSPDPLVVITFGSPTQVRPVLLEVARAAAPSGSLAVGWPAFGVRREAPEQWPPADPTTTVAMLPRLVDQSVDYPPDLVLTGTAESADLPDTDHPVLGRPSQVRVVEPELTWDQWEALPEGERTRALVARGPSSLGAVDEHLVNPVGFERDPDRAAAPLTGDPGAHLSVPLEAARPVRIGADGSLSDVGLPDLRSLAAVRLDWSGGSGPQAYCRAVAGLAMAGVPLVTEGVPEWAGHLLVPELVAALDRPVDLGDRLRREEHSVLVRRAAQCGHGTGPWRRRLAEQHGLQQVPPPRATVLLATRRPEMVDFALRQVGRQRGADFEVVLAGHGFDPDAAALERFRRTCPAPLTALSVDASVPFGEVLNRAAARAGGEVLLKMDDDDWYGPDFVADLMLARAYSGAQLVGCPAEFTYLAELDITTRGRQPTEVYTNTVAGGTILVDRTLFHGLGGFRHTARYVDATLMSAVAQTGATTYRTHGLGYVLRRASAGHTWDPGLGYFLTAERAVDQWRGFRPSAVLEAAAQDRARG